MEDKYIATKSKQTEVSRVSVSLVGNEVPFNEEINSAIKSVQSALDDLVRDINATLGEDTSLQIEVTNPQGEVKKTLNINIKGQSDSAKNNEYNEPIDSTYQRKDDIVFDKNTSTLYWN